MRNPFKRNLKDKTQPPGELLHGQPENLSGNSLGKNSSAGQPVQTQPQPVPAVPPVPSRQPQVATEQTMEFLKRVEPDDILELLFPRLVTDQKTRLEACTAELEEIDKELTRLHLMRDDVLNTQAQQSSGVANF